MFSIVYYDLVMAIFFVESSYPNLQFLYYNRVIRVVLNTPITTVECALIVHFSTSKITNDFKLNSSI